MTVTVEQLRDYAGASPADDVFLAEALAMASAELVAYIGHNQVPTAVFDMAVKKVGREVWRQRNAPGGVATYASLDGVGVRVSNDVLASVYRDLDRYVPRGL